MKPPSLRCSRRATRAASRAARRSAKVDMRRSGSSAGLGAAAGCGSGAGATEGVHPTPWTSMAAALCLAAAARSHETRGGVSVKGRNLTTKTTEHCPARSRRWDNADEKTHKGARAGWLSTVAGYPQGEARSRTGLGVAQLLLEGVLADHLRVGAKERPIC